MLIEIALPLELPRTLLFRTSEPLETDLMHFSFVSGEIGFSATIGVSLYLLTTSVP